MTAPQIAHDPRKPPVVLVVDDDPGARGAVACTLRSSGFVVEEAENGADAVAACRARPDEIAVVLMDIQMPELDGFQALQAILRVDPLVRCFLMTGDPGVYTPADLKWSGAERVFGKPLDFPAVIRAITDAVAGCGGADAARLVVPAPSACSDGAE